jgi:hypothetical protein
MLLTPKKLAFLGLLLSLSILLIILSGMFEFNTLFLLAAASFCIGIAIRESSIRIGIGYYLAGIFLGFLLAPNKLYCLTYAAMGLYIVILELAYERLTYVKWVKYRIATFWIIKYLAFNVMYIPILIYLPKLIYPGPMNKGLLGVFLLAGQIVVYVFDKAYLSFHHSVWGKIRTKLHL